MAEGFVKLHRSFLKWEWYSDESCVRLFLHLLLTVNWKPGRFMGHDIPAGSAAIGSEALAKDLGWNRAKLRRTLDKLKATGEVATKPANKWTLVTLVNWAKYQDGGQQTGQQNDTKPARERPANRPENGHNRIREEEKKGRMEEEKESAPDFEVFWDLYGKKVGRVKAEQKWHKLKPEEQERVLEHVPAYVSSTPEVKFRKDPSTYLNGRCWEDEIINRTDERPRHQPATGVWNANR